MKLFKPSLPFLSLIVTRNFLSVYSFASTSSRGSPPRLTSSPQGNTLRKQLEKTSTSVNAVLLDDSFSALDAFYHTQPYLSAFLTCSVKASAADMLAQSKSSTAPPNDRSPADEETQQLDVFRNLAFILYGGFYQGIGQAFLYAHLYPQLFGSEPTVTTVLAQASIDNFMLAPFFCLPTVYTIKSLLAGGTPQQGLEKYWDHIHSQNVLLRYWSIWFPVQCLNFSVVPEHLRVPFCAFVSFFWVCMLSSISSQETTTSTNESSDRMVEAPTAATSAPFLVRPRNPLIPATVSTVPGYHQRNVVTLSARGDPNQESKRWA